MLDALKGGAPLLVSDTNEDANLRGVLGFSFDTLSPVAQNMVGENAS